MTEVDALLIAAEALVLMAGKEINRFDKRFKIAEKNEKNQPPWKTRDEYQSVRDDYWHLYDDLYTVIEELKERHNFAGIDGFVKRHLEPIMDLIGDKLKESNIKAKLYEEIVLNPLKHRP